MSAGYSGTPLPKKLGIGDDVVYVLRHAPAGFTETLGDTGASILQRNLMPPIDVVVAFFTEQAKLLEEWPTLTAAAEPEGSVWVAWPKQTSGLATDINENVLRSLLLKTGWVDNKVCAIDATWSGLRFVMQKDLRPKRFRK